ncbi:MAG: uracil-xanthine permease, partial [Clostridia bacterium]|nr:uracil-xanthine permease [Clostridia bacterium]
IPFIIGIIAGYIVALIFTLIGRAVGNPALRIIDFAPIKALVKDGVTVSTFISLPKFTFIEAIKGVKDINAAYIGTIAVAYIPVAFVVFAEHIADHKNLSSIIGKDLLTDPGLSRTLLGDGIGSFAGAIFGGCPNTTYGESIGCVAITGNASVISITGAAILAILFAFISPFVAFLDSIPACVMGGVCMTLYGFIAVSGLKMLQPVDLNENRNLFVASVILIAGVGGLALEFALKNGQSIKLTTVACALILGIITNLMLSGKKEEPGHEEPQQIIK